MNLTSPPGLNARDWGLAMPRATPVSCMILNVDLVLPATRDGLMTSVAFWNGDIKMTTS